MKTLTPSQSTNSFCNNPQFQNTWAIRTIATFYFFISIFLCLIPGISLGKKADFQLAIQSLSLAPNAGGQVAYSLKGSKDDLEVSLFSNQSLSAGDLPYSGALLLKRFSICDSGCFWQIFTQLGAGGSNGGPLVEITWGIIIPILPLWLPLPAPKYVPALRLDVTSQIVFIRWRGVTWTYPFWVGISVPI